MSNCRFDLDAKLWRAVIWTLRISIAIQCLGLAREALLFQSPVFEFLWNSPDVGGLGWNEARVVWIHQIAGWCLVVSAGLTLVRPCWPVLMPVVLWQLLHVIAKTRMGGDPFYEINLLAQSTRILAPLGLMLLDPWPLDSWQRRTRPMKPDLSAKHLSAERVTAAFVLLRIAVAITFAAHGFEAWQRHPKFVDFNIVVAHDLLGWSVTQDTAEAILAAIGTIDLVAAVLLLLGRRWRAVVFYMAFWGLVTALARVVYAGAAEFSVTYHQTFVRACHAGVPLAIGLYWTLLSKHADSEKRPPSTLAISTSDPPAKKLSDETHDA